MELGAERQSDGGNGLTVSVPNGYATIYLEDMQVRSTAGVVRWSRQWNGLEWKFNPHWESLSQSWKNMTGSQAADTTSASFRMGGAATGAAQGSGGNEGCWVWVDEDWQPSSSGVVNGVPQASPMLPERTTPFNRLMGEASSDYLPAFRVSVDYASLCPGASSSVGASDLEGIRRQNELYLGEAGRYAFSNRAVLEKRVVRMIAPAAAATVEAQLATGSIPLAPITNDKGYRWIHKEGDWIDYNTQGQVVAYGDRNDNTTWLVRDTTGKVKGVVDGAGRVLYTLHYTGNLLTEVRDYPMAGNALDLPQRSVKYQYDAANRLTQVTDVRGNFIQYEYDAANRIVKIIDQEGRSEQLAYNGEAVAKRTAPDGGVTEYVFEYDDTNKQFTSKITGPVTAAGRRVEVFTHNRVGKLVRRTVNGRTDEEVQYDTGARAEIYTNARGFATRALRNEFDQIVQVEQPDGSITKKTYSALHLQLTEEIDEEGYKTQYQHDARGNLLKTIEAAGTPDLRITEYEVNNLGQIIRMIRKGRVETNGISTSDAVWQIEYDAQGQVKKVIDPEGHARLYVYNRAGHLVQYTDGRNHATRYEVDAAGNLIKVTNALNHVQSYAYDKVGNLVTYTDARSKTSELAYDAMNRKINITNPIGGIFKKRYNLQGLVISETDEDGRIDTMDYDNFSRVIKQIDAMGNSTQFSYQITDGSTGGGLGSLSGPTQAIFPTFVQDIKFDELERPTAQTIKRPNEQAVDVITTGITYDKRGLITREMDVNGKYRTHKYDALRQHSETTDALGAKTYFYYDARGNLVETKDAKGNVYKFEFDRNNRITKEIMPLGQTTTYTYDAVGNVQERIDPNGNKTINKFDSINRLIEVRVYDSTNSLVRITGYEWDNANNLIAWSDKDLSRPVAQQSSSGSSKFDNANRKVEEVVSYPTPSGETYVMKYGVGYSFAGKKTQITWPDGTKIDYAYSNHGELESVSIPGEGTISVTQFKWTAPVQVTFPGGGTENKSYDGLLNLEELSLKSSKQQPILKISNSYGKSQEITSQKRTDTIGGIGRIKDSKYSYDDEIRLTKVVTNSGSVFTEETELFTLDKVGNRIGHNDTSSTWQYDANNRLLQRGIGSDSIVYSYDESGNLIKKTEFGNKVTRYTYDAQNRLIQIQDGNNVLIARYGYDPFDRRIWKEQFQDRDGNLLNKAKRTYYLYSEEGLLAEAVQEISLNSDQSASATSFPDLITQYGVRPDSEFSTGTLFIKTKNSELQNVIGYYHYDHIGSPVQITDKLDNLLWSADVHVFGKATVTSSDLVKDKSVISNNLRLPGQYADDETGFHYNFRRYYDPETARYITVDPLGLSGGMNLYLYANANPLLFTDSRGENPLAIALALARMAALMCARYPRICKEMIKCARNPVLCRDRLCKNVFGRGKGRDRLVHKVCDSIPSINGATDSCAEAVVKCSLVGACLALRKAETLICFGGKPHKPGDNDDIEKQVERRLKNCIEKTTGICRRECTQ